MTLTEQMQAFLEKNNGEPPEAIMMTPIFLKSLNIQRVEPDEDVVSYPALGLKIKFIENNALGPGEAIFCSKWPLVTDWEIPEMKDEILKSCVKVSLRLS